MSAAPTTSAKARVKVLAAKDLSLDNVEHTPASARSFATAVRALLQNWRQGTVGVKDRSEVSFANRKPWRQKGTGRARAGSARSPLWRHGGVCHGPQPRTRVLSVPSRTKQEVFKTLFFNRINSGSLIALEQEFSGKPSASTAYGMLKDAGLHNKKIMVFVRPEDQVAQASFANLANVQTICFDQPNAFDLAKSHTWVVLAKDINALQQMVHAWL